MIFIRGIVFKLSGKGLWDIWESMDSIWDIMSINQPKQKINLLLDAVNQKNTLIQFDHSFWSSLHQLTLPLKKIGSCMKLLKIQIRTFHCYGKKFELSRVLCCERGTAKRVLRRPPIIERP